jgi:hypothetical protein
MMEALKELLDRDPFVPFTITLTSGERFQIRNPHLVALGETMISLFYPRSDWFAILRANQISSFESLESAA